MVYVVVCSFQNDLFLVWYYRLMGVFLSMIRSDQMREDTIKLDFPADLVVVEFFSTDLVLLLSRQSQYLCTIFSVKITT